MTNAPFDYIRDPTAIYAESFRLIREVCDLSALPPDMHDVAVRLVHSGGRPEILENLRWSDGAAAAGRAALASGAPVLCDVEMVAKGVIRDRLPAGNDVLCTLSLPGVRAAAVRDGTTRSAAAVGYWERWVEGAVVAVGNAPTALFRLLELVAAGWPRPALVLGFPVGFVGAAESKDALIANDLGLPFIALAGREGGSAYAAAAVNALAAANVGTTGANP